jgi:hypothetical protein
MDVRINEIQSRVQAMDSQSLLDPRVLQQIIRACVQAIKDDQTREKQMNEERSLTPGNTSDDR